MLQETSRPSVQEGSALGGRNREPRRPRGGHGLAVSVHASLAGRQGLGAECQGRALDSHWDRVEGGHRWEVNKTTLWRGERAPWPRCGEGRGRGGHKAGPRLGDRVTGPSDRGNATPSSVI